MSAGKQLEITFNLETGKGTVEDPLLGKRELDHSDALAVIRDQLKYLMAIRRKGNPTKLLKEDIRVYKYILAREDAVDAAEKYINMAGQMRDEQESFSVRKMDVVKRLGWVVP